MGNHLGFRLPAVQQSRGKLPRSTNPACHIQWHKHERHTGTQNHSRRLGICPKVELRAWPHIAMLVNGASHGDYTANASGCFRFFENKASQIGERAKGEHVNGADRLIEQERR